MRNGSTGQFKAREYLEAASSLSVAQFEGIGLLQHSSYSIGQKCITKRRILHHAQVNELSCGVLSYLYK